MFRKTGIQDWGSCIQIECRADAGDWLDNMTHRRVPLFIRFCVPDLTHINARID